MSTSRMHPRARRRLAHSISILAIITAGALPGQAQAQQADPSNSDAARTAPPTAAQPQDKASEIIVTGSRLSAKAPDQPIMTINAQTLSSQGYTNIGQALTDQPMFGVPANSPVATQGSYGAGQTFANLYNLGSQRTLTLVNGNRFVSAATSSVFGASVGTPVDLGQIAPALVDHIDVVGVGGAPIYGADAIAGTVNIVLKKNFSGIDLTGSQGLSQKGDGNDYNISLLVGKNFADGRGNITLNVYYDHQDGLATADRYVTSGNRPFFGQSNSAAGPANVAYPGGDHFSVVSNTGIPTAIDNIPFPFGQTGGAADPVFGVPFQSITNAAGQSLYFNAQGKLVPFVHGGLTGSAEDEAGGNGFASGNYGNLLTQSHRIQGVLLTHYDFDDHIHVHAEGWLSRDISTNVADQTLYNTALFSGPGGAGLSFGNYILSATNPYLSAADQATIQGSLAAAGQPTNQFYLARANTDLYEGGFTTRSSLARVVGGIDGDFTLGTHHFTWEGSINYGQTNTLTSQPGLVFQNIQNAINAVVGPGGNIICQPGYANAPIATLSNTCSPLNLFGTGHVSQAALNYITAPATSNQIDKELDAVVDIKGDIIKLPAGPVRAVLGGEIRRESQFFDPGTFFSGAYSQYAIIAPVSGSYRTHEGFGELTIPVIDPDMHIPLLKSLNLHGAARYTDNSLNGGFWSYTGGGDLSPAPGLTIRGNFTRSFREPSVTEAFAPLATNFESGNDPCDTRYINGGSNPAARAANCTKAGVPAGFSSIIVDSTVQGLGGGNPHLGNEIANSWTVGASFVPAFLRGLSITGDYIHIDIGNEITQPGIESIMQACYDSPSYPNSPYCGDFTRDPTTHQITSFTDTFVNIGTQKYRAAQIAGQYDLPLSRLGLPDSVGALHLGINYLHEFVNQYQVGTGSLQYNHDALGEPADAVTSIVDWQGTKVDWSWTVIYDGPTKVNANNPASDYEYYRVNSYWMANTSIGFTVNDHFSIRAIVNNVFNLGVTYAGTVPQFSTNKEFDAIFGRSFRINAHVKF